ncbi:hypothetical protein [Botrimarina hoheduenensis]|uniref:Uncharacterized protein n=1 Tax=Botrimarina hoheduenensis TaxID=2528000 RepID=A0A5C5VZS4_9BACT|nr:hypothetical protein [Botrimarina hoheduenensis]TWT43433.1 hypothetical protein Pla111_23840 [Botrimarina hoheduenensis]
MMAAVIWSAIADHELLTFVSEIELITCSQNREVSLGGLRLLVVAFSGLVAPFVEAAPLFRLVDNQDGSGVFQIAPDASLFPTAAGGSIAFEIDATITGATVLEAVNGVLFPVNNPGDIGGSLFFGTQISAGNTRVRAAYGSNLFTTTDFVDALLVRLTGPATINYNAAFAQGGMLFSASGSEAITLIPEPAAGLLLLAGAGCLCGRIRWC